MKDKICLFKLEFLLDSEHFYYSVLTSSILHQELEPGWFES